VAEGEGVAAPAKKINHLQVPGLCLSRGGMRVILKRKHGGIIGIQCIARGRSEGRRTEKQSE